jgi:hypothetical protein
VLTGSALPTPFGSNVSVTENGAGAEVATGPPVVASTVPDCGPTRNGGNVWNAIRRVDPMGPTRGHSRVTFPVRSVPISGAGSGVGKPAGRTRTVGVTLGSKIEPFGRTTVATVPAPVSWTSAFQSIPFAPPAAAWSPAVSRSMCSQPTAAVLENSSTSTSASVTSFGSCSPRRS